MFGSSEKEVKDLRTGDELKDPKSEALRVFALAVYEGQGRITDDQFQAFLDAGFTRNQALDVVANIAAKVMTNFANQMALTPVDEAFSSMLEEIPFAEEREINLGE